MSAHWIAARLGRAASTVSRSTPSPRSATAASSPTNVRQGQPAGRADGVPRSTCRQRHAGGLRPRPLRPFPAGT
ncbi:hypothetical protein [Kitasatospora sp. NPDC088346]|uniref:hypothetical protein n=1 Tax=Kitasatospora sp. NPDC088346 TaxID=3364073 RepID=UPI0038125FD4